ncbi:hypothetical protein [Paenarthrobacter sp. NPDC090522]|uniref:hypothetical protein n=1 Tax=Paenarthrobacter sp. NPDC090522 TaxID=3364383 RepID=UPI0038027F9E
MELDMPNIGQTILYIASGVFPMIGLNRFFKQYKDARLPAIKHEHRTKHQAGLRATRDRRLAGTDDDCRVWELHEVDEWQLAELAKNDPWGKPYSESDQKMGYVSPGAVSLSRYKQWKNDLRFVFLGIISATLASIWAVWF